jgi:hypothetical protein
VARRRGRIDRDDPDLRQGAIELGRGPEARYVAAAKPAGADHRSEREIVARIDHGEVLILRNLAEPDDGDLALGHRTTLRADPL